MASNVSNEESMASNEDQQTVLAATVRPVASSTPRVSSVRRSSVVDRSRISGRARNCVGCNRTLHRYLCCACQTLPKCMECDGVVHLMGQIFPQCDRCAEKEIKWSSASVSHQAELKRDGLSIYFPMQKFEGRRFDEVDSLVQQFFNSHHATFHQFFEELPPERYLVVFLVADVRFRSLTDTTVICDRIATCRLKTIGFDLADMQSSLKEQIVYRKRKYFVHGISGWITIGPFAKLCAFSARCNCAETFCNHMSRV